MTATSRFRIADVRAYVPVEGRAGGDYHGQSSGHWLVDTVISTPMSIYPEFRENRTSWGIRDLGGVIVEIETEGGATGLGYTQGGDAGCFIVERHFRRFLIGADVRDVERLWDEMWRGSLYYGRKGLAVCAISGIDLALWDLCGKLRDEPVYLLLGGAVRRELPCYVTGPQPARYQELGFFGGKMPLPYGPASGRQGLLKNVEMVAHARDEVGPDFDLMLDCYMSLTVPYTIELAEALRPYRVRWIEEPLLPDDYDGHARIKAACPWQHFTTGEHEYTRYGFRELIARQCVDILQPDLGWVGGITEARRITAMAAAYDIPIVPHGGGTYSLHFQLAFPNTPFQEVLAMSPDGMEIGPVFGNLFAGQHLPANGRFLPPEEPGFGLSIDHAQVHRPYAP